ncbi:MAG TPA: PPOX class F420-dependent oxidoreductase [Ktedonobacteraceae bacterium]|nr:PPOX class F420-dependent oxidoreductase [Ktedonobacteraceae bacterium]
MLNRFAAFNALYDEPYISLTTFRKNGDAVATPVWFAQDMESGLLYIKTGGNSGKVKRIRHTPRVTLAPCTARGTTTGDVTEGNAYIVTDTAEVFRARGALHRKYGLQRQLLYFVFELVSLIRRNTRDKDAFLAIGPME